MSDDSVVPSYEPMLAAYHRGFAAELRAMVAALPLEPGQFVLDMACGDGVYSPWLVERVGPGGRVVAVDLVPEYLELARKAAKSADGDTIDFVLASIDSLPFADGTFDLCWCAQSLYSLPDPVEALRRLARVTKPGGFVAVSESDTLHHVILPWPVEIELSVRAAELQALVEGGEAHGKFYIGRLLRQVFREAGLVDFTQRSFANDRLGPFKPNERTFFAEYLNRLAKQIEHYLDPTVRADFDRLTDPHSAAYLLDDPDVTATCIDHLVWGRKPAGDGDR
jgi:ubiquinone/menaquinone biosynthesis C-methylase UbiE